MASENRIIKTLTEVVSVAGAVVSIVEFINLFRHEAGIKKELYCNRENRVTTHVTINWDDLRNLRRKALEDNLPSAETLPNEIDITLMSLNPLAPKPHICLSCQNVKWE